MEQPTISLVRCSNCRSQEFTPEFGGFSRLICDNCGSIEGFETIPEEQINQLATFIVNPIYEDMLNDLDPSFFKNSPGVYKHKHKPRSKKYRAKTAPYLERDLVPIWKLYH